MATADDVTIGEVYRLLGDVRGDLRAMDAKVEERPDWQDVRRIENSLVEKVTEERARREAAMATANRALKALEDRWDYWSKLMTRTVTVGLLGAAGASLVWAIGSGALS